METIQEHKLFIINGHGSSISNNYILPHYGFVPTTIILQPNQYVIMYNSMDDLRGSAWLQEELWKNIL
jgi:hypothetical protein